MKRLILLYGIFFLYEIPLLKSIPVALGRQWFTYKELTPSEWPTHHFKHEMNETFTGLKHGPRYEVSESN